MSEARWRLGTPNLSANTLILRRLGALAPLSTLDERRVRALQLVQRAIPAETEISPVGAVEVRSRFLIQGWACRLRTLPDGRRQIFHLVLPGDLIGCCLRTCQPAAAATVTLTRAETVNAAGLAALLGQAPPAESALATACAALEHQSEALLLDQIMRLGQQTAYERMAHLLLEVWERLSAVGLAADNTFQWPLGQGTMAELLGLSVVHVNRTLQQLRRDRVIELRGGVAVLLRPERLQAAAEVAPARFDQADMLHFARAN